jgi:phage-related protein
MGEAFGTIVSLIVERLAAIGAAIQAFISTHQTEIQAFITVIQTIISTKIEIIRTIITTVLNVITNLVKHLRRF